MNTYKNLVLLNGIDKTESIESYRYNKNLVMIKFYKSSKEFSYSRDSYKYYKFMYDIDMDKKIILIDGIFIDNVDKAICFDDYVKLFFKDKTTEIFKTHRVMIEDKIAVDSFKSKNMLCMLKEIANITSIVTENGYNILSHELNKINIVEKDSPLYEYLYYSNRSLITSNTNDLLFPFGSNLSQMCAIEEAFKSRISVIEGPPGTGKTNTIINIIANIVNQGKKVAVVSNNNAATENVYEKLAKYNLDFICAKLGSKNNKDIFIEKQKEEYPDFDKKLEEKNKLQDECRLLKQEAIKIYKINNEIAELKSNLEELKVQKKYFNEQEKNRINSIIKMVRRTSSDKVMNMKVKLEDYQLKGKKMTFFDKVIYRFIYGIGNKEFYEKSIDEIILVLENLFLNLKEYEIIDKINTKKKELVLLRNDLRLKKLQDNSLKLFKEFLREKYQMCNIRSKFIQEDLWKNTEKFLDEYPVILSTTYSIKSCLNMNYKFDYVIMDEASQVDLITGVLALSVAKNIIIVGDEKQLPNIVQSSDIEIIKNIMHKYDLETNSGFNYIDNSFLSSIKKVVKNVPITLLKEHYRCHPKIINFCNKKFYNNELIIMTEMNDIDDKDVLKAYIAVEGNHKREKINQRQIDIITEEVLPELSEKVSDIAIISPYRDQKNKLKMEVGNIPVDTVHKFQGREKEGIVITTVDDKIGDFVDNPKMLNVAVTRAQKYLRVVTSGNEENQGTNIDDLVKYIKYNNFEVVESKVKSIYDLLYKCNMEKRLQYLKKCKRISEFDSENLTYNMLLNILKKNEYNNLDIVSHIPLKSIIKDWKLLDKRELAYISNDWTHVDFLIYNKMDKMPVIVIEVDGYYFHKENTEQYKRDEIKDNILNNYGISMIRLKTNGSGEIEKIEKRLKEILKI